MKVTLFGDRDINQLVDGKKEHEIHYPQHSHLEIVPIISYYKNHYVLFMIFELMFRVSQSKMMSLSISVTALFLGVQLLWKDFFLIRYPYGKLDIRKRCLCYLGRIAATQWPTERHPEMCS